ncbi:MAG TPA: C40 family peptidase, partial [Flavisolibacter sp.]|nr:C40 family peptidase [Flavisolibacter sp.]
LPAGSIDTKAVQPQAIVDFAKTFIGVPYLYGSTDPSKGFDCSGFITYVFNHFKIAVPRSSIDFTAVGKEVSAAEARPADLILFTGTDSTERFVGHMGIVVSNTDTLRFIHSTSGKMHGVTITPLNDYYKGRYVKTVRVFP